MLGQQMKHFASVLALVMTALTLPASAFVLPAHQPLAISVSLSEKPVVFTAVAMFQRDALRVLGTPSAAGDQGAHVLIAGTWRGPGRQLLQQEGVDLSWLDNQAQAFVITTGRQGRLIVAGSDAYGTAYGLMELSRMLGVSPWEWWADVDPEPQEELNIPDGFRTQQAPNVSFRGIFINDEDWGLLPWATKNYEPNELHAIGPKTTERIFELMLRLRANLYWPPMHECTRPFFLTEGNRELAARYGIFIGSSHCEPLGCNAAGEWGVRGVGDYNIISNHDNVLSFWEQRLQETAHQPMVYTLGMRGLHDGKMQGVEGVEQQKRELEKLFAEQRQLLSTFVSKNVAALPQVFIPYKEVLEAYNAGLQVPEDVTLMWTDDNYGYIRHFPTPQEAARRGGNGIYYHVSYWGRPHDYLWLGTASPFLMFQQMSEAYYHGANRMWVLNVGDIKPSEYQISLFMDMAWDLDSVRRTTVGRHMEEWYAQTIGRDVARLISVYMKEHYHLSFQMKPEHLAGTRVEEPKGGPIDWNAVRDLPWSEAKIRHRLTRYDRMSRNVQWIADSVSHAHPNRADAYFQLVEYPVKATIAMNMKYLLAQLARHGKGWLGKDTPASTWERSDKAHEQIQQLTARYNALRGGKWNGIMSASPRNLTVFKPLPHQQDNTPLLEEVPTIATFYGASYQASNFRGSDVLDPVLGLGASIRAMPVPKGCNVTYKFKHDFGKQQYANVEIHMLPTHPIEAEQRFTLSMDGGAPLTFSYRTHDREEEWKQNVLRGYAVVLARLPLSKSDSEHSLQFSALDDGVVVDEVFVRE